MGKKQKGNLREKVKMQECLMPYVDVQIMMKKNISSVNPHDKVRSKIDTLCTGSV